MGANEWKVEHRRGDQGPVFSFRTTWKIDAPPTGEQREVQIAQLRHRLDLQAPQALLWSKSALVTTAATPHELQAEATRDSITLSWGPHAAGLAYVARLQAVQSGPHGWSKSVRVSVGPLYEAHFGDLLPDTMYRVEVYLDDGRDFPSPLDQHRFELRTEPAPAGWSRPTRIATNIRAVAVEGGMEVTWTPPDTGARHQTSVCAHAIQHSWWSRQCESVPPGQARALLPLDSPGHGGTFVIQMETFTAPAGIARTELHVPTYDPDLPTRGGAPVPPRFSELHWSYRPEDPRPTTWRFEWDEQGAELVELSWRQDDREFIREVSGDRFYISLPYGKSPEAVRMRQLRDGAWTPWSGLADLPDVSSPPYMGHIVERDGNLEVHWKPPQFSGEIVGYRLYVTRDWSEGEVIDVGAQTSARIPINAAVQDYWVQVSAVSEQYGELGQSFGAHHERGSGGQRPEQDLVLQLPESGSWCQPTPGDRARIEWSIRGGAAPFIVSIGDRLGFETVERRGSTVVECVWNDDRSRAILRATVFDARGDSASASTDLGQAPNHWEEEGNDPAVALWLRSVHRDRVLLSWSCHHRTYRAVLRWRAAGESDWTYDPKFAHTWDADWVCRAVVDGLQPLTAYEYQLARIDPHEEVRRPNQLRWTETQTVSTLGEPQQPTIERDGETVSVSWERRPHLVETLRTERGVERSGVLLSHPLGSPTRIRTDQPSAEEWPRGATRGIRTEHRIRGVSASAVALRSMHFRDSS